MKCVLSPGGVGGGVPTVVGGATPVVGVEFVGVEFVGVVRVVGVPPGDVVVERGGRGGGRCGW